MSNSPLPLVLAAAAVVLCSGVAAYVGAGLARHPLAVEPSPTRPAESRPVDSATLESIDRRLDYLKEEVQKIDARLDAVEGTARAALERGDSVRPAGSGRSAATPPAPTAAPEGTGPAHPPKPEDPTAVQAIDDGAAGHMAEVRETYRKNTKALLAGTMKVYADTSEEGTARRFALGTSDADNLARRFGLDLDKHQEEIRTILRDEWEQAARDIGPIVRDGLEKADVVTVRERLRKIHADTDQRLRPLFDDATWKTYEETVGAVRKNTESVLDEFDRTRPK